MRNQIICIQLILKIFLYISSHHKTQNLDPSRSKPHVLPLILISFLLIKCREKYPQIKV